MDNTNYVRIVINGEALPAPSEYKINIEDLDAEGQRPITTGVLMRKRIRANVLKVELTYVLKDMPNVARILSLVSDETFTVQLYGPVGGEFISKTMYCGPKKFEYVRLASGIKAEALSFSLIEV